MHDPLPYQSNLRRAGIPAIALSLCLACNASCSFLYVNDNCAPTDPECGAWITYLFATFEVRSVYASGVGQRGASSQDWWLKKFSTAGVEDTTTWNKIFDGGNNAPDQTAGSTLLNDGSLLVGGSETQAGTSLDWALRKYSVAGVEDTMNWAKSFDGGNSGIDQVFSVTVASDGGVFAIGKRNQAATNDDWWLKKYDANGVEDIINWNKIIDAGGSLADVAYDIAVAGDGSVYVVGAFNSAGTMNDWHIKKFSAAGVEDTVNWNKTIDGGGSMNDTAFGVAIASDGGVFVVGDFNITGPGPNFAIKKFFANGIEDITNWNKTIDGGNNSIDSARELAIAPDGSLYVVGSVTPIGGPDTDWWIKKFSADGIEDTASWNKIFDGGASQNDAARTIQVAPNGDVYVAGTLNPGAGNVHGWIKKFTAAGVEDTSNWNKVFMAEAAGSNSINSLLLELTLAP